MTLQDTSRVSRLRQFSWVHSADKNGADVGHILDIQELGVTATTSSDELLALNADCACTARWFPTTKRWCLFCGRLRRQRS